MKKTAIIALVVLVTLFTGCKTMFTKGGGDYRDGERSYKAGDFDAAATKAMAALAQNPEFPEAKDLLKRAAVDGPNAALAKIEQLKGSGDKFANDKIFPVYETLEKLHKVMSASSYASTYPTTSYADKAAESKTAATEAHYAEAVDLMKHTDFRSARSAWVQLDAAAKLDPNYKDSEALRKKAMVQAQADVLVVSASKELEASAVAGLNAADLTWTAIKDSSAIGGFSGLEGALSGAKAQGFDFVVVLEGTPAGALKRSSSDLIDLIAEPYPMKGVTITNGYEQSLTVKANIYDASGVSVAQKDVTVSDSDSYTFSVVSGGNSGAKTKKLNLENLGKGTWSVIEMGPNRPVYWGTPFHQDAIRLAKAFLNPPPLESFKDYKKAFDKQVVYEGVDLFSETDSTGFSTIYNLGGSIDEQRKVINTIKSKANQQGRIAADRASKDFTKLYDQAGAKIASAIKDSLK